MEGKYRINLSRLRFYSRIGVFEQERVVGNEFEVSVTLEYEASNFKMESLDSTISYADVYEIIREEMGKEWLLLESVCAEISNRIKRQWPLITQGKVEITKLAPPIKGIMGTCGVEYIF